MQPLTFLFATVLFSLAAIMPAAAQKQPEKKQSDCIAKINERTAALVAQDWAELERMAEYYSKECKGVFNTADDSTAYEQITLANFKRGNVKKAIAAADTCIRLSFSNSGCHVWRIEALLASGRMAEARIGLDKLDRLIAHLMEGNDKNLAAAMSAQDKELCEAIRHNLQAQAEQALALRDRYFRS